MKSLLSMFCVLIAVPVYLQAQSANELLQKVSALIAEKRWSEATEVFQQAIGKDVSRASIYYRVEVDKECPVALRFAEELAIYYKNTRSYDKAYSYYKELLKQKPGNVLFLSGCAESAFGKGSEDEAVFLYKKVLTIDSENLRANIFLGSYYFMEAEKKKNYIDADFHRIVSPNSMQRGHYKDQLKDLYSSVYLKAKSYLEDVLKLFPSMEAKKMLETIAHRNEEIN